MNLLLSLMIEAAAQLSCITAYDKLACILECLQLRVYVPCLSTWWIAVLALA